MNKTGPMNQHARLAPAPCPFIDLVAQRRRLGEALDEALARVTEHCQFINGPEVRAFETTWRGSAARAMRSAAPAAPTR